MELKLEQTFMGIEFGSTRIKAVLIDENYTSLASGEHAWENELVNGIWTYSIENVWIGLQDAYSNLKKEFENKFNTKLTKVGSIGFSAMMHGYLPFDEEGKQLTAFRTWRNTTTEISSEKLSELFKFNIPQRWSISHLYQAILDNESHVKNISYLTTLVGYVHWQLTGEKVLGVGEASGMFPIDSKEVDYNHEMIEQFNQLIEEKNYNWTLEEILPSVQTAGEKAGHLTEKGARLLDPSGYLEEGILLVPPEGDAGTGMIATNSISEHTGNVSAGTSIFSMIVLEKELSDYYVEIDMVTTPTGKPVAMVHCNNFTTEINDWVNLFEEVIKLLDLEVDTNVLFTRLFEESLEADDDVEKLLSVSYHSGEPITGFEEGRPLIIRTPDSKLTAGNFMRSQIYSALATLKIGMDILTKEEEVEIDDILGHGGFFKTENIGQQIMADALNVPVSVMATAGEGGPWGMAVLASYVANKKENQTLEDYLNEEVFATQKEKTLQPKDKGKESFEKYLTQYKKVLEVEREAIIHLK